MQDETSAAGGADRHEHLRPRLLLRRKKGEKAESVAEQRPEGGVGRQLAPLAVDQTDRSRQAQQEVHAAQVGGGAQRRGRRRRGAELKVA